MEPCLICREETVRQKAVIDGVAYYTCPRCKCIFKQRSAFPTPCAERERYLLHENDVEDTGYQIFVQPLVSSVQEEFPRGATGLDYGAGTGPVASKLLMEAGYSMSLYDPFFHNTPSVLNQEYDFIICCEVVEHFHDPLKEFNALYRYLVPGGTLFCMTERYDDALDFERWYYKNDPTHVVFYTEGTFKWLTAQVGFSHFELDGRLAKLTK